MSATVVRSTRESTVLQRPARGQGRRAVTGGVAATALLWAAVAGAQAPATSAKAAELEQIKQRQRISLMEGVLERAVANGADNLLRQVKNVMPDMPMLTGAPAVRGFRLEGYGVFFDVEVPALRLPLAWTLRYVVDGNRLAVNAALAQLRALVLEQPPQERDRLEGLVRKMEQRTVSNEASPDLDPAVVRDPNEAYTRAVKEALIDAMLESSGPMNLGPDEWLTVAARDNVPRDPLVPGDSTELNTVIFKVKGSDLAAFRTGGITLEEARKRVDAREN
jgi:hypothetical protein